MTDRHLVEADALVLSPVRQSGSHPSTRRSPSQKVAGLKGHTDPPQLLRSLASRWLRWLAMIMEASSIDSER